MTTTGVRVHYRPEGLYGTACHPDTDWGHELHATDDPAAVDCRSCLRSLTAKASR